MSQSATSTRFLNPSRDGDSTTALGSLFQCLTTLSKEIFPNIQSKPPLMQLEAVSSHPSAGYLGEEINPHLTTPSCQVVVESDEVSSEPHQRRVQSNNLFPTPSGHTISETSQDATGRVYLELQHV